MGSIVEQLPDSKRAVVAKEYRFSVVMYGGVSLAIYMNGAAQELLHMVRSTARTNFVNDDTTEFRYAEANAAAADNRPQLKSTEAVYRQLAYELNDPEADDVRFLVDVISGTSAGGINGIFLAKALTDDAFSFDALRSLWVSEGAIENLLNDQRTWDNTSLPKQKHPKSLLCSDRMYIKLLDALGSMKPKGTPKGDALAEEIDLFATTTDIHGRVIPLRLADMLVYERRHKADFHFSYREGQNKATTSDFVEENNPFLAFVARCTSSFPFAFEPMQLSKLKELQSTKAWPKGAAQVSDDLLEEWQSRFFDDDDQVNTGSNLTRPFGDGGYLNNAPFSFVVSMLGRHSSAFPTERKLIYIEPSPEHPEEGARSDENAVPTAIENSYDALIKLPGLQPIHDDLQRVIERNRLVRKVNDLTSAVTSNIFRQGEFGKSTTDSGLCGSALSAICVGDFSYLVLRAYATTDDLSKVMAEWLKFQKSSSFYFGLRCIVRAWRERKYQKKGEQPASGEELVKGYCRFLEDFDLDYEKRKYRFVRQQINLLYCFDGSARRRLKGGFGIDENDDEYRRDFRDALIRLKTPLDQAARIIGDAAKQVRPTRADLDGMQAAVGVPLGSEGSIRARMTELLQVVDEFKKQGRAESLGLTPPEAQHKRDAAKRSGEVSGRSVIEYVLGIQKQIKKGEADVKKGEADATSSVPAEEDESYVERADAVLTDERLRGAIERAAASYSTLTRAKTIEARTAAEGGIAAIREAVSATKGGGDAIKVIEFYLKKFEQFDTAIFPLTYDTEVGTPEPISIIRVSPDDAKGIFEGNGSEKLAGSSIAHFGAFLDRSFRNNDILWGRLDGAERIIRALMTNSSKPDREARATALINAAHTIILSEFLEERKVELAGVVHEVAKALGEQLEDKDEQVEVVRARIREILATTREQAFKDAILGYLTPARIREYLKHPVKREPDRRATLESFSRAVGIVGGMLEGLSKETKSAGGFLARVSTVVWWLVEAAVPGGLAGHAFRKVFAMLFWFEVVMIVGGTIFSQVMQALGLKLLAVTVVLWLVKDAASRFLLAGKKGLRMTIFFSIVFAVILVTVLAVTPARIDLYLKYLWERLWCSLRGPC